jgi:hypothetical protein
MKKLANLRRYSRWMVPAGILAAVGGVAVTSLPGLDEGRQPGGSLDYLFLGQVTDRQQPQRISISRVRQCRGKFLRTCSDCNSADLTSFTSGRHPRQRRICAELRVQLHPDIS